MLDREADAGEPPTRDLGQALDLANELAQLPAAQREQSLTELARTEPAMAIEVRTLLGEHEERTAPRRPLHVASTPAVLGRYELEAPIGAGSMGTVYRARQRDTGRLVAVKLLRADERSEAVLERFHREVQLLARLQHPGIVQILDAGHAETAIGPRPFLAMELVAGSPVLAGARRLQLPLRQRVQLLVDLCQAVAHAHQRGVIHRDLKPDNVLLESDTSRLQLRVLDFGVAVAATSDDDSAYRRHLVGTLGYLAPEQIDGAIDVRCDVYSLGAIGYELLTDHQPVPVRGLSVLQAIDRIRTTLPEPAGRHDARLRGDLEAVLAKALASHAEDRYGSAADFAADLERWLQRRPVLARRTSVARSLWLFVRRQPLLAGLAATLAAVAATGLVMTNQGYRRANEANDALIGLLDSTVDHLADMSSGAVRVRAMPEELRRAITTLAATDPDNVRLREIEADLLVADSELARRHGRKSEAMAMRLRNLDLRRALANATPSPSNQRELAIAYVLVGDIQKELATTEEKGAEAAGLRYRLAHDVFLALHRDEPALRQRRDDLAHSWLRLAWLAMVAGRPDEASSPLTAAEALVVDLARTHADHPFTIRLLREFLGISGYVASQRGDVAKQRNCMDRMIQGMRELRRLEPENAATLELLLATVRAGAEVALAANQLAAARQRINECLRELPNLTKLDPLSLALRDERLLILHLAAELALREENFMGAVGSLNSAVPQLENYLVMGGGDALGQRLATQVDLATRLVAALEPRTTQQNQFLRMPAQVLQGGMARLARSHPDHPDLQAVADRLSAFFRREHAAAEAASGAANPEAAPARSR